MAALAETVPRWSVAAEATVGRGRPAPWSRKNRKRFRILIAGNDDSFRKSLRLFITQLPQLELIGEAVHGFEALDLVRERQPDLVLLDLYMPGIDGWQAAPLIHEFHPATRVIITANDDSDDVRNTCLTQGADGFISEHCCGHALPCEIGRVLRKLAGGCTRAGRLAI